MARGYLSISELRKVAEFVGYFVRLDKQSLGEMSSRPLLSFKIPCHYLVTNCLH